MNSFISKYGYGNVTDALFKSNEYVISNSTGNKNTLKEALEYFNGADRKLLEKVYMIYSNSKENEREEKIKQALIQMYGSSYNNWKLNGTQTPTLNQIKNYKEYSEFKSSKFRAYKNPEYENGQIKNLYFTFDN